MTEHTLPPPCPNCSGTTALKELHKLAKLGSYMCFFFCVPCALEYPRAVDAEGLDLTGWAKHPGTDKGL